ncbi:zinc finger protein on ecdysone puffs isoform X1 [Culex quinquefasciatus]|uniref:zinc finger protein on ecdysone puffs isoform X1 n=1 Tax=Culex quinquefasciatus TaxID=7176 RepID=UPI0018E3D894|nr:zinc finger protein on ecdysone puffs isoform X1 [Culex quinquefasciatus]
MAYRNNNRRNGGGGGGGGGGNFGNNYGAGRINPWDTGVGGGRGNNDALTLANSLINNLLRNQNSNQVPPSLLDGVQSSRFDDMNGFPFVRNRYGKNRNNNGPYKGGIRKPDAFTRSKNVLAKNSHNKNKSDARDSSNKKESNKQGANNKKGNSSNAGNNSKQQQQNQQQSKSSPYDEVSNEYLYCHMCDKHMYDATSFENHITGRTHRVMKESIEESYRMRATLLRQEARIAEQLKTIEIDRLKRMGKAKNYSKMREYCPMCELFFYGHIIAHRRSEKHLDLKKFLHPKCDDCELEFHNRTEYDDHLLSVVHMKNCKTKPSRLDIEKKAKQLVISTANDELLDIREETAPKNKKKDKDAASSAAKKTESNKASTATSESGEATATATSADAAKPADSEVGAEKVPATGAEDGAAAEEPKPDEDVPEDEIVKDEESADCILDYKFGDEIAPEIDNKLPRYKKNRALGISLISKLECHECRICHKYFDTEETGEIHARTHSHYRAFIRFLNEKAMEVRISQKRAAVALEEAEAAKKQKLAAAAAEEKKAAEEAENGDAEKKDPELYDPSEATGEESGDASMADDSKSDDANGNSESQQEPMETDGAEANKGGDAAASADEKSTASSGEAAPAKSDDASQDEAKEKEEEKTTPGGKKNSGRGRAARSGRYGGRY